MVVVILAEAAAFPLDAPEWERGADAIGAGETGAGETRVAATGAVTGMDGTGGIRTANGVGGMVIDGVLPGITLSS
jgi:hypothetical protein